MYFFGTSFRWHSIGIVFASNTQITKFNEFVNFTGIRSWREGAFGNCSSLTEITLPNNITTIPGYTFRNTKIAELVVPATVTSIGGQAFYTSYLTKVTMLGTTPPTINANCFADTYRYYYVPASALDTYKAANTWSSHANNILAIPD